MAEQFALNLSLASALRNKINEHVHLIMMKNHDNIPAHVNSPNISIWDCVCAIMDRIDASANYLCSNTFQDELDSFKFMNFMNIAASMIDCINKLADVLGIERKCAIDSSSCCFNQIGLDGTGTDKEYFEYLRSLCSVHPVDTTRHKKFQGNKMEWCPYISIPSPMLNLRLGSSPSPDLVATVYTSEGDLSEHIQIYLSQIFSYISMRFDFISNIITGVDDYYARRINELRSKIIAKPSACPSYDVYIANLKNEVEERSGKETVDSLKYVVRALKVRFDDKEQQRLLIDYQNALRAAVTVLHETFQNMQYLNGEDSLVPEEYYAVYIPNRFEDSSRYHYQLEKLEYLNTAVFADDMLSPLETVMDECKLNEALRLYDCVLHDKDTRIDEVSLYMGRVAGKLGLNNSEWARVQVRIMFPILEPYIKTSDLFLSNIELYTLVKAILHKRCCYEAASS